MENKGNQSITDFATEIEQLKNWKESQIALWGPVIDYVQNNPPAKLKLGQSISEYILNILKHENEKPFKAFLITKKVDGPTMNPFTQQFSILKMN
jgi:hypothetical protein